MTQNSLFTVDNPAYEKQRLQSDKELQEINEETKKNLLYDPYLKIAYALAAGMIKP